MFDNPDLLSFLKTEETDAYDGTLLQEVETAIKSYNGEPYGDEEDGRSQVVARDVAEVTDYMLTSIIDVISGSGRIVEFEPTSEEDEDQSDDATEAMHYIYRRKRGYTVIHDWAKAGLLEKIAVVKSCVERKVSRQEQMIPAMLLPGETEEELRAAGIIEAEEAGEQDGIQMVKVVTLEEGPAAFPDYYVPLEEFRFAKGYRDLDSNHYVAHHCEKSLSDLVEMGFQREEVEDLQGDGDFDASLRFARNNGRDITSSDLTGALRKVWLAEEYVLFDLNGDGIAERLCIHRVGNTILDIKEVDYQPFEYWCPYPMPGTLIGQSLADKVVDIQRVNTALERNGLDSLYMSVAPGTLIHEDSIGDNTIDDLLTIRPRRIVRFKGAVPPVPEQIQDISSIAFEAIEFKTRQRESRTGITRLNKGVDEDTLNDTAKGQAALMARGQQMERYIIRNFAEGVARLFMRKVQMMRRYGEPFNIKVDGEYRQVDPGQWPESLEVNVKVGLGSGSKDERIGYRMMIAQSHETLKMAGSPLVTDENVYNNLTAMCKDAGLQPNDVYTHPDDAKPQQERPDPMMIKVQADIQAKQAELEMKHAHNQSQLQLKLMEIQGKMVLAREDAESQFVLAQQKQFVEAELARQQQAFEAQLEAMKLRVQARSSARDADRRDAETGAKIKNLRKGGRLDK
jgi:hypothetical protein